MGVCRSLKMRILTALGVAAVVLIAAAPVHAQRLECAVPSNIGPQRFGGQAGGCVEFMPAGMARTARISHAREDAQAFLRGLQCEWDAVRADLVQSVLETTVTAFFIRIPPPPKPPKHKKTKTKPPPQNHGGEPPPPPPPPPPPGGNGEPPQLTPPPDPPQGTPEPASFVIALLGAGLTSCVAWRRRHNSPLAAKSLT
jgi:PEP-CTERM motif